MKSEHPSAHAIWNRALEVFGDEAQARSWMDTPRDIFGGRSPQDLVTTGDPAEQRRVLEVLIRIELRRFLVVLPMKIYGMHRAARAPGDYKGAIFGKAGRRPAGIPSERPCCTRRSTSRLDRKSVALGKIVDLA